MNLDFYAVFFFLKNTNKTWTFSALSSLLLSSLVFPFSQTQQAFSTEKNYNVPFTLVIRKDHVHLVSLGKLMCYHHHDFMCKMGTTGYWQLIKWWSFCREEKAKVKFHIFFLDEKEWMDMVMRLLYSASASSTKLARKLENYIEKPAPKWRRMFKKVAG